MRDRPRRDCQEFAAVGGHREGKALPERLRNERHDRVQQSERVVEEVSEDRARDLTIAARRTDATLRSLEIPVCNIVPDETSRGLRVFAQTKPGVTLFRAPFSFLGSRRPERCIGLQNRGVQSAEYPAIGQRELVVTKLVDASHRGSADVGEQESSDVPELCREVSPWRE